MSEQGSPVEFRTTAWSGAARSGQLSTRHGLVQTPAFMPVATQGTVKSMSMPEVRETGAQMVIMNTYHLWLRPTPERVAAHGGLHELCRWPHPIVTDSGGFQAFSLASLCRLTEEGFAFASHLDGRKLLLTPEESMRIQAALGSDIAMQLDVCPPADASPEVLSEAVARTTRWAERCLLARDPAQAVFGIVQGGTNLALRRAHAETLARLPLDGLALGGLSVGEPNADMHRTLAEIVPLMDPNRIRYLMGVGTPADLVRAIGVGVDLFDCVMPTRNARNGQAFVKNGRIVIKQARYEDDRRLLDEDCPCLACKNGYSRAMLRHFSQNREMLAARLLSSHNLTFYARLVALARQAIAAHAYDDFQTEFLATWDPRGLSDAEAP